MDGTTILLVFAVAHVVGFFTSIEALLSVRTPQGAIAWVLSLNLLPAVALPAYWIFGRSRFRGYIVLRRSEDEAIRELAENVRAAVAPFVPELLGDSGRIRATEGLAEMPFVGGNEVELLIDGDATFDSILAGIARAQDYVLFQFFIVKDDRIGRVLRDRLVEAAQTGVRVSFLYDEVGSHQLPRAFLDHLRAAGVDVRAFHSTRGTGNRLQLNFRNHRKIVVVDGHEGWVGGHNVGDEYLGRDPKFGHWRDTHVRVVGPAVLGMQWSFLEDWHWATGGEEIELSWEPKPAPKGDVSVLNLPSGPADELETASLMFQHAIHAATDRIWIASPYFIPDEGVLAALQLARLRGVDVRVLIPEHPDHLLVYLAAFAFVGKMLDSGVKVYRYQDGFMHGKAFLVDDFVGAIGTANLDNRSFRLNFEITTIVLGLPFAREVEAMFEVDFEKSIPMTRAGLDARPFWFRAAARAAYLTAPLL